jgi:hypothetical protein|tara:strand:- start:447 stop:758 length:312 start_codon:yes stop_codon:yes gene_type:complete
MDNDEVCGSKNVFTHLCSLWMDNDQETHEYWRHVARYSIEMCDKKGNEWFHFEDVLKEELDSLEGDVLGLHSDLLGAAIGQVDTREIAKQWIENELENMEVTG